jgi:hypothetical protein
MSRLSLVVGSMVVALSACTPAQLALHPEVVAGPARTERPRRIAMMPPLCGSVERPCREAARDAVSTLVRSRLEYLGYPLIGSSDLLLTTRQRKENEVTTTHEAQGKRDTVEVSLFPSAQSEKWHTVQTGRTKTIELVGSTFEDLSVTDRAAVLKEAGADGTVVTRVILGGVNGVFSDSKNIEVLIRASAGDTMMFASRCSAQSEKFDSEDQAIEYVTRCALEGVPK